MHLTNYQISKIRKEIALTSNPLRKIVIVDVMGDQSLSNQDKEVRFNIYCVDASYNIIWQITDKTESRFADGDPFYYLGKNSKNDIIADRFSGFVYKINPETGEATRIGFHK